MMRADSALQALLETPGLREDLTDEEAAPLFAWAEAQLLAWDAAGMADDAFEAKVDSLRALIGALSRVAGQRSYASVDAHAAQVACASAEAQSLGLPALSEPVLAQDAGGADYMQAVLAQLVPTAPPPAPDAPYADHDDAFAWHSSDDDTSSTDLHGDSFA